MKNSVLVFNPNTSKNHVEKIIRNENGIVITHEPLGYKTQKGKAITERIYAKTLGIEFIDEKIIYVKEEQR